MRLFECRSVQFFLTEPRLSLGAYGSKYPITFAVMFAAALLTGTLATKLKAHALLSARDAYRTKLLFDMNRKLQKAEAPEEVYQMTAMQIQKLLQRDILVYPVQGDALSTGIRLSDRWKQSTSCIPADDQEQDVIHWVWQNRKTRRSNDRNISKGKTTVSCYLYLVSRLTVLSGFLMEKADTAGCIYIQHSVFHPR